jgi:hypothetical protein
MMNGGYHLTHRAAAAFQGQAARRRKHMRSEITIRRSTEADRTAIARLAELDSRSAPAGDALLAFVDDELRAAVALDTGVAVADPFHPTAELVQLLRVQSGQRLGRTHLLGLPAWRHAAEAA